MEVEDFESRILGDTIDLSIRHREAHEKAVLFRLSRMPVQETLVRLSNEVVQDEPGDGSGTPCYIQPDGEDAIDIGYITVTIDKIDKCTKLLRHSEPLVHWVANGVIGEAIRLEELMGTVLFKKGGDLSGLI